MRLERIPWAGPEVPSEAVLRGRLEAEGFGIFRWHDQPGASYSAHAHDHDDAPPGRHEAPEDAAP